MMIVLRIVCIFSKYSFILIKFLTFNTKGCKKTNFNIHQVFINSLSLKFTQETAAIAEKHNGKIHSLGNVVKSLLEKIPNFWLKVMKRDPYLSNYFVDDFTKDAFSYCVNVQRYCLSRFHETIVFVCLCIYIFLIKFTCFFL